jgi:hypothetical protein
MPLSCDPFLHSCNTPPGLDASICSIIHLFLTCSYPCCPVIHPRFRAKNPCTLMSTAFPCHPSRGFWTTPAHLFPLRGSFPLAVPQPLEHTHPSLPCVLLYQHVRCGVTLRPVHRLWFTFHTPDSGLLGFSIRGLGSSETTTFLPHVESACSG